jgi:hypothetical protein
MNVHRAGGVRQTEIHAAEPFVAWPSASEVEAVIAKSKTYEAPGVEQVPAQLI